MFPPSDVQLSIGIARSQREETRPSCGALAAAGAPAPHQRGGGGGGRMEEAIFPSRVLLSSHQPRAKESCRDMY